MTTAPAPQRPKLIPPYQYCREDQYAYVRRSYKVAVVPGQLVRHAHTRMCGTVLSECENHPAMVMVAFSNAPMTPCHPLDLRYD